MPLIFGRHEDMDMGMGMGMGMGGMTATATPAAVAATTAAAGASHGHDDGQGSMDSMGSMMMSVFQSRMSTALYTTSWTPQSPIAYAATCVFLVVLSVIGRALLAGKSIQEARWLGSNKLGQDKIAKQRGLSEDDKDESFFVNDQPSRATQPWRLRVDLPRAVLDTVIAAVGYLL